VRGARPTAVALVASALALACGAPPPAGAEEPPPPPIVTSITPNELSPGQLPANITIGGSNLEGATFVRIGAVRLRVATRIASKGECAWKGGSIILLKHLECPVEPGARGRLVVVVETPAGHSSETEERGNTLTEEPGNTLTVLPELFRNEHHVAKGSHIPAIGYGQLELTQSPGASSVLECVNLGFGAAWSEGSGPQGEILEWTASGHAPYEEHTELGSTCRFIWEGVEENQPGSPVAWVSAEQPLAMVAQTAEVCIDPEKTLAECPLKVGEPGDERQLISVVTGLHREPPALPWNFRLSEREGKTRIQIGLPEECRSGQPPHVLIPCSEATEASEREVGTNPEACVANPDANKPAPEGCVRVDFLIPALNFALPYEGYLEPRVTNGVMNGLSPGAWEFEGTEKEPCLVLRGNAENHGCVNGFVKILGSSGQELLSIR
jgi:hypothetical protein